MTPHGGMLVPNLIETGVKVFLTRFGGRARVTSNNTGMVREIRE